MVLFVTLELVPSREADTLYANDWHGSGQLALIRASPTHCWIYVHEKSILSVLNVFFHCETSAYAKGQVVAHDVILAWLDVELGEHVGKHVGHAGDLRGDNLLAYPITAEKNLAMGSICGEVNLRIPKALHVICRRDRLIAVADGRCRHGLCDRRQRVRADGYRGLHLLEGLRPQSELGACVQKEHVVGAVRGHLEVDERPRVVGRGEGKQLK